MDRHSAEFIDTGVRGTSYDQEKSALLKFARGTTFECWDKLNLGAGQLRQALGSPLSCRARATAVFKNATAEVTLKI